VSLQVERPPMSASLPVAIADRGVSWEEEEEANVSKGRGGGWFVPSMRMTIDQHSSMVSD
jgi:hypothetical protein